MDISVEEWLAELERLGRQDPGGHSVEELAHTMRCSRMFVYRMIHRAIEAGCCEHAGFRTQKRIDGRTCHVPVYRFTRPGQEDLAGSG